MRTTAAFVAAKLPNGRPFSDRCDDAQDTYDLPIEIPFASMAYNDEDGWFVTGAFLTKEEAEADMAESKARCPHQKFDVWADMTEAYVYFSSFWWPGIDEDAVYGKNKAQDIVLVEAREDE